MPNEVSRSLEDGGSSLGLTQAEIIFVTLACFVVAIASIFTIYTIYTKRRQAASARQNNNVRNSAVLSPVIKLGNGMNQQTQADVGNSMVSRESTRQYSRGNSIEEDRTRRASLDSVDSTGRKQSRRRTTESASSNVSSQYKVAAINHMRRMSDAAER